MELVLDLEIWAASVLLAAAAGWALAISRPRRTESAMSTEVDRDFDEPPGFFTLKMASRAMPRGVPRHGAKTCSQSRNPARNPAPIQKRSGKLRSRMLLGMPPATDPTWQPPRLRQQLAEFMRTADLESLEVLRRYRSAINDLNESAARRSGMKRVLAPGPARASGKTKRRRASPTADEPAALRRKKRLMFARDAAG